MNKHIKKIVLTAILLSIGYLLPLFTMQYKTFGQSLLPMHLPVLIEGFIVGPLYGALLGLILPVSRSLIFGMPILYPNAITMSFELCAYGFLSGLLFKILKEKNIKLIINIYISLISAMVLGRLFYMVTMMIIGLYPISFESFSFMFDACVIASIPGIIIQLFLIPLLVTILVKTNIYNKIQGV